jgi:hypothetical protein
MTNAERSKDLSPMMLVFSLTETLDNQGAPVITLPAEHDQVLVDPRDSMEK